METSRKYGFNLPSRDGDDIADINLISDNFRKAEDELNSLDQKVSSNIANINGLDAQVKNVTGMVENAVIVAGEALASANMAQETANSADTTALEAYERSVSAAEDAARSAEQATAATEGIDEIKTDVTEAKSRVEHISDALSENRLLHNIEGENWEYLGDDAQVTGYTLISAKEISLSAGIYYKFSIITPKIGEYATLYDGRGNGFVLKYTNDRYTGKVVFTTKKTSFSGWYVNIQNDDELTRLSTTAPIVIEEEILPDRVKVYLDNSPTWEESSNDEATQYNPGIMHVLDDLELAAGKEYKLSFNIGAIFINDYVQTSPYSTLVKKTISGEFIVLGGESVIVNDGVASGEFTLSGGVEQGETLYLSLADPSDYVKFDTSSSEVFIEWVSNTKEILDYLSLKGGSNENLGDIEAALDGIIAIQNELIGGGSV